MAKLPDGGVGLGLLLRGLVLWWGLLGLGWDLRRSLRRGFFTRSFRNVRVGLLGLGLETAHCYASYDLLCLGHLLAYLLIMADII